MDNTARISMGGRHYFALGCLAWRPVLAQPGLIDQNSFVATLFAYSAAEARGLALEKLQEMFPSRDGWNYNVSLIDVTQDLLGREAQRVEAGV